VKSHIKREEEVDIEEDEITRLYEDLLKKTVDEMKR
jgi:hypothetical protein